MKWVLCVALFGGCFSAPAGPPGSRRDWEQQAEGAEPGPQHGAKLAYDESRKAIVMYTGRNREQPTLPGQVWMWKNNIWSRICTGGVGPPPVYLPGFTWEPQFRQLVLVGGARITADSQNPYETVSDEIWTCDTGDVWTKQANHLAVARVGASLIYQPIMKKLLLIGGRDGTRQLENMEISGADASDFQLDPVPMTFASASGGQAATYDDDSETVLALESVLDAQPTALTDAIWQYDGSEWTRFCDDCSGVPRTDASIVHFGMTNETYVLGAYLGDSRNLSGTWIVDHDSLVKVHQGLADRDSVGVAWNGTTDTLVTFGGAGQDCASNECDETYELVITNK